MFKPDDYWAHGPLHKLTGSGVYMVTAGTLYKQHFIDTPEKLTIVQNIFSNCHVNTNGNHLHGLS